jgi:tetratricopeptide (TPR) repeat protein
MGGGTGGTGAGGGGGSTVSSSLDPINPQARTYYNQGVAYAKEKKWFLAIAAYTQAVRIEPKFAAAWNNLGHSDRKAQQYGKALDAYKQAIGLAPDNPHPHEYMARTYLAMGNKDAATREYEIVRRLDAKMAGELLNAI